MVKKRDDWIENLSWVNIRMGLMVLATMLLVNSPLLDFRKISVASQMARLESGAVSYEDFDIEYIKNNLVSPGYDALQALKSDIKDTQPILALKIENAYSTGGIFKPAPNKVFDDTLIIWPEGEKLPPDLAEALHDYNKTIMDFRYLDIKRYLYVGDLNGDDMKDYLLVLAGQVSMEGRVFYFKDNQWQNLEVHITRSFATDDTSKATAAFENGPFEIAPSPWKDMNIGFLTLKIIPE